MSIVPMIIISLIAGLLSTMNVWTYNVNHIRFHLNDVYMALLMTSWMVVLDNIYHYNDYQNNDYQNNDYQNNAVIVIGIISIITLIYLIKNQVLINDRQFINGMIPHHSMAILMAEKIKNKSKNKKIIDLANNIIKTQNKEIEYMKLI